MLKGVAIVASDPCMTVARIVVVSVGIGLAVVPVYEVLARGSDSGSIVHGAGVFDRDNDLESRIRRRGCKSG